MAADTSPPRGNRLAWPAPASVVADNNGDAVPRVERPKSGTLRHSMASEPHVHPMHARGGVLHISRRLLSGGDNCRPAPLRCSVPFPIVVPRKWGDGVGERRPPIAGIDIWTASLQRHAAPI